MLFVLQLLFITLHHHLNGTIVNLIESTWKSPNMRNLSKNQCVAAPLPCRGGAGVGSVSYSLSGYYRPHPAQRAPLPLKGGEWLARQFEDYIDFLKWTHYWPRIARIYIFGHGLHGFMWWQNNNLVQIINGTRRYEDTKFFVLVKSSSFLRFFVFS